MVLREEEVRKIKDSAVIITLENVQSIIAGRIEDSRATTFLDNGYKVIYSIGFPRKDIEIHQISIYNSKGETDPAEAEWIARDILGERYKIDSTNESYITFKKIVKKGKGE